jgi:hypothetical protein
MGSVKYKPKEKNIIRLKNYLEKIKKQNGKFNKLG